MEEPGSVDVVGEFGRRKRILLIAGVTAFLLVVTILIIGVALANTGLFVVAFGVALAGGVYINFVVYRCPNCGGYPGRALWGYPRHCQNCGAALE